MRAPSIQAFERSARPGWRACIDLIARRKCALAIGIFVIAFAGPGLGFSASEILPGFQAPRQFGTIFEPSGVQQLPDGRILVVEDEKLNPIKILTLSQDGEILAEPVLSASLLDMVTGKPTLGKMEDLEGVDIDDNGYVYAITSHSRTDSGKRDRSRERLVRFKVDGSKIVEPRAARQLKKKIVKKHRVLKDAVGVFDVKKDGGLNIEGLSFDKSKKRLLIGLRSPVIDTKAVIVVMENPDAVFENGAKPKISDDLIYLDLKKGGIRGIAFDPRLKGYLILSRREDKTNKSFKLWFWDGDPAHAPRKIKTPHSDDLDNAEGVTPIRLFGQDRILIVSDDGNTNKRTGAHYLLLTYEQLEIDSISN